MPGQSGHLPVMPELVTEFLALGPNAADGPRHLLDATVGLGGHAQCLLSQSDDSVLIGLDVDKGNLALADENLQAFGDRVILRKANFADARGVLDALGVAGVDGLLADLGISSSQLDDPARGLSFTADGPLDMRLDASLTITAADLLAETPEKHLADLIYTWGEERYSRRIASAIVAARQSEAIERTSQLAELCVRAYPRAARASRRGVHPATRTFQALRIAVNDEMGRLETLLRQLPDLLNVGGRACLISFHSLEDRRLKHAFADWARCGSARLLTKKPQVPEPVETARNRRARSAKLRCLERIA